MMRRILLSALAVTLAGAAAPPIAAPGPAPAFAPLVDYHQHLASPAGVAVPPELASVLTRMGDNWDKPAALADLYAEDALVLAPYSKPLEGWALGRAAASDYVGTLIPWPYRLTPTVYRAEGPARAHVAGFVTRAGRHFGYFYFDLVKEADGAWRIAVDNRLFSPKPEYQETISGRQLVALLDTAGIGRAVLLSDAYWFDSPKYRLPGQTDAEVYALVRAENDWTAGEAAGSGGRLVALCSFNPKASYALSEMRRCAAGGRFAGLKFHLQMSEVDLGNPADVAALRAVFAEANRLRLPIVVHAQTKTGYTRRAAETLVNQVVAAAPDIPVTIAHLWGGGALAAEPLAAYADAVAGGNPAARNLWFDVAEAALVAGGDKEKLATIAAAIRKIGPARILFGSDAVGSSTLPPARAAAQFRADVPLTEAEFAIIAGNLAPYMRKK
jgi:uncharacterized protein